jgi:hypothetical protein
VGEVDDKTVAWEELKSLGVGVGSCHLSHSAGSLSEITERANVNFLPGGSGGAPHLPSYSESLPHHQRS